MTTGTDDATAIAGNYIGRFVAAIPGLDTAITSYALTIQRVSAPSGAADRISVAWTKIVASRNLRDQPSAATIVPTKRKWLWKGKPE